MNRKLLATLAAILLGGPLAANAVPIQYDMVFDAEIGPGGVGSFWWDADVGTITDFAWNLADGAYIGGVGDRYDNASVFGGTQGQFVFEILTQADVHPTDCVFSGCSVSTSPVLNGPPDAYWFTLGNNRNNGPALYSFATTLGSAWVAFGTVSVTPSVSVPEPGTLALFAGGARCHRDHATAT